jgi:hypothetical protein
MARRNRWYLDHRLQLELFVLVNLAFLAPDIYVAHCSRPFPDGFVREFGAAARTTIR